MSALRLSSSGDRPKMTRSQSAPDKGWGEDDISQELRAKGHRYVTTDLSVRFIRNSVLPEALDLSLYVTPTGAGFSPDSTEPKSSKPEAAFKGEKTKAAEVKMSDNKY